MDKALSFGALIVGLALLPVGAGAAETSPSERFGAWPEPQGRFSLTLGAQYTRGGYGADATTDMLQVPVTGRWNVGDNSFRLTVPCISMTGPGATGTTVGTDPMGGPIRRGGGGRVTNSGPGDVLASCGRIFLDRAGTTLEGVAQIKFGTADATRGLGAGENDYAAQVNGYRRRGAWTPRATAGYAVLGDPPGTDFNNVAFGALGASVRFDEDNAGLIYDHRQASIAGGDPQRELTFCVKRDVGRGQFQAYALKGFGDASPDRGPGALVTAAF